MWTCSSPLCIVFPGLLCRVVFGTKEIYVPPFGTLCLVLCCRGHGTYVSGANLVSNTAGLVERVDRLVSVRPVHSRYIGEVGDIVVGRVLEVRPIDGWLRLSFCPSISLPYIDSHVCMRVDVRTRPLFPPNAHSKL